MNTPFPFFPSTLIFYLLAAFPLLLSWQEVISTSRTPHVQEMEMAGTIFITGATGLIGVRILLAALAPGHTVRYTTRLDEKAKTVSSNAAVQKLAPSGRLSPAIIPDFGADGAFDAALQGVTHVIHAGSPVPMPTFDPMTETFEPTIRTSAGLLSSALKTPSVQRVIITSSIVANLGLTPPSTPVSASTRPRCQALSPPPSTEFSRGT